jgi:hypothetical protein
MTYTVTIPFIGYEMSVNSLVAFILLLCIFFTFFSVTISFDGLNPTMQSPKSACSHSDRYYEKAEVNLIKSTEDRLEKLHSQLTSEY